ncbi:hypothetical protein G6M70_11305 [Agrobacterium tumefaciens]|uniref:hypothetical protein n=1 Tax=Agrobacterium tumefaciens TaxID=358 RepID=UPI001572A92D|nr:hypothetical protein [Agrobacterium tumefaciens]NSZ03167.1 hypothetical protein [Agrobacterium tumefaciens]NSZ39782.1 hypothetical protein [Agrobacterium tumefaciens]NTB26740.1 hypothetical protein [Agrobacterium tumefaciens]NTB31866.1 hypothetical protein [Agrobacterium tumefaciens]NTB34311.1 hypothetical protein [Agrobacterium tumefaciens]
MELLLNGINGNYLRNILLKAENETERVDAAVAYATQNDLLFDWCWDKKVALRFWGRFDEQVPVSIHVLERFLTHRSGRYVCKLGRTYNIPEKVDALARQIFTAPKRGGVSAIETLFYVLYGGRAEEVPHRLWEATVNPKRKIELVGISALGEIVGWAMPDKYPPRNGRTSKALRSLGHDVAVHV